MQTCFYFKQPNKINHTTDTIVHHNNHPHSNATLLDDRVAVETSMGATLTQHIWKFAHLPLVKLFTTPLPTIPSPVYCQRTCTWFVTKWLLAVTMQQSTVKAAMLRWKKCPNLHHTMSYLITTMPTEQPPQIQTYAIQDLKGNRLIQYHVRK